MLILGIETSCDETAVGIVADGRILRANAIASQAALHAPHGGVVPELASRQHIRDLQPTLERALAAAEVRLTDIDAVAVTHGPGLAGALISGLNTAKALALTLNVPLLGVNHLEGHIYAAWLDAAGLPPAEQPGFPLACLVASGGHTDLILMEGHGQYRLVGRTRDDAAGEAFDKAARVLGLGFPGGPEIQRAAAKLPELQQAAAKLPELQQAANAIADADANAAAHPHTSAATTADDAANANAHPPISAATATDAVAAALFNQATAPLPRAWMRGTLDFSFSGVKTALLHRAQQVGLYPPPDDAASADANNPDLLVAALSSEFQEALVDVLVAKLLNMADRYRVRGLILGGGVTANARLRQRILADSPLPAVIPPPILCTDNGAMIAAAAYYQYQRGQIDNLALDVDPSLGFEIIADDD